MTSFQGGRVALAKLRAAMFPKEKGKLDITRFQIPYRKYGESGTPWAFAINGAQSTMATWFETVITFPEYQWVIFDYPGQGGTNIKEGPLDVTWDEQIMILDKLIEKFAPNEKVNLISASWGGAVAMYYAANNSHRLRSLILGSVGTLICNSFGKSCNPGFKKKILKQFEKMSIKDLEIFAAHVTSFKSKKSVDEVVDLTKIMCPTLIINGEDDPIIDNQDTQKLNELIPHSVSALLPNTSHFLHLEDPTINTTYYKQFVDAFFTDDDGVEKIKTFKFDI